MWKLVNNQQPKCLKEKFPLKNNEAINNPSSNKMIIPYRRITIGKRSLSYEGYKLWNLEIPDYIMYKKPENTKTFQQILSCLSNR